MLSPYNVRIVKESFQILNIQNINYIITALGLYIYKQMVHGKNYHLLIERKMPLIQFAYTSIITHNSSLTFHQKNILTD